MSLTKMQEILLVLVLTGAFSAGYLAGRNAAPPKIETKTEVKTETVEVEKEKIVTKVVKVKEKAPDGTVKETTTTEKVENSVVTSTEKSAKSVAAVLPTRRDWAVDVITTPRMDADWYRPTGAAVSYRVLDNVWATGGYDWNRGDVHVGIRVEF